ncbi:MAG: hypothetical protein J5944_04105 [Lentisphaeria bacterium]|nr:hypothetical protein [Lentisphaeria bacterium]
MMNTASSILLKRFRQIRPGGLLIAAAILLVFTDFFHFAFHDVPARDSVCACSLPSGVDVPDAAADPSSPHNSGFCPVCEGILISDGPPLSAVGLPFSAYAADPIFSGIDSYISLSFLLPQGRAPPRAA